MKTELLMMVMAGMVLSLFLIVGEVAALRKQVKGFLRRQAMLQRSGRRLLGLLEMLAVMLFFLVQPVIVGALVALALDSLNPGFSDSVLEQVRNVL